jgi:hypothetical protein
MSDIADLRNEPARLERSLERLEALERENVALKKRVHLLECFVDVRHRERAGLTTDDVRAAWHGKPPVPEYGAA